MKTINFASSKKGMIIIATAIILLVIVGVILSE